MEGFVRDPALPRHVLSPDPGESVLHLDPASPRARHVSVSVGSAAILVLLLTPYTLGLLQAVWSVPFLIRCPDPRLPPVINILMGILSSLLEVGCVTWFTSHVASQLPVFVVIPALASVMALSSVSPWLSKARGPDGKEELADLIKTKADSPCCRARPYLALLCMLGPSLAAAILLLSGIFDWYHGAVLASSTFLLSVVWSPGVVYRTISVEGQVTLGCKRLGVFYAAVKVAGVFFFVGLDLVLRSVPGQDLITTATSSSIISGSFIAQTLSSLSSCRVWQASSAKGSCI
ncbi:uncharacterized protein LOC112564467 [Pomacea canaliculata]|uniref:uncharacterized protein LOC112564467 n=1 Tax=Pomacea canaliculata TaxID=400727 RepID=UPI000D72EBAA|nr:uncharacterized protein LOC112564467 [Pomacea canaliculata]